MSNTKIGKSVGFISDQETKVDLLRNKAIATTIIEIINSSGDKPLTVGVHGYWGAGKSSVLEMIAEGEFADCNVLVVRFNGWQFEGFEDAKIALVEGIVDQLAANKTIYFKAKDQITDVIKRIDWLKAAKKAGGLAFTAMTGLPSPDQAMDLVKLAVDKISDISALATPENMKAAADSVGDYLKDPEERPTVAKNIREFHESFNSLIQKAELDRLIVLVDDLDRCLPETAIETLEAIRLFVMLPKTAFVIGADETMIRYAVTRHFPDLPSDQIAQDYPRAYLEKLIQVPFRIPAMGEAETRSYLTLLVVGSIIGETSTQFSDLLTKAETYLSSPWLQKSVGDKEVAEALDIHYTPEIATAVAMVGSIAPMLAWGTNGNPRNVKRFMNSLTLRLAVAKARGFGETIDPQILAKLMLVEQFAPSVFDDIAREVGSNPGGFSATLNYLEQQAQIFERSAEDAGCEAEQPTNVKSETDDASRSLAWITYPKVADWVRQLPLFADTDLRPYLFVVNDVGTFSIMSAAIDPALLELVEKFKQGQLVASSAIKPFEALSTTDQVKVFDELRHLVLATTNWTSKPDVLDGLVLLVNKAPAFESRYLDILEHLPASKLGGWAEAGHDRAVQSNDGKKRLQRIRETWKETGGSELSNRIRNSDRMNR